MLHQVVGAHEAVAADGAGEALLSGVRAAVAGKLVRPGEALVAPTHWASVRALTYVGTGRKGGRKTEIKRTYWYNRIERMAVTVVLVYSPVWFR